MANNEPRPLDGYAAMADEDPFKIITKQPPPNNPRIKELLSRALMEPDTLTPPEVQEMAASLVYFLLSQGKT